MLYGKVYLIASLDAERMILTVYDQSSLSVEENQRYELEVPRSVLPQELQQGMRIEAEITELRPDTDYPYIKRARATSLRISSLLIY